MNRRGLHTLPSVQTAVGSKPGGTVSPLMGPILRPPPLVSDVGEPSPRAAAPCEN